jgi:hypothetical protein
MHKESCLGPDCFGRGGLVRLGGAVDSFLLGILSSGVSARLNAISKYTTSPFARKRSRQAGFLEGLSILNLKERILRSPADFGRPLSILNLDDRILRKPMHRSLVERGGTPWRGRVLGRVLPGLRRGTRSSGALPPQGRVGRGCRHGSEALTAVGGWYHPPGTTLLPAWSPWSAGHSTAPRPSAGRGAGAGAATGRTNCGGWAGAAGGCPWAGRPQWASSGCPAGRCRW